MKTVTRDKHALYLASVQDPEHDAEILQKMYMDVNNQKKPQLLREDFCGTFALCCEWVKKDEANRAIGLDLCQDTLEYGKKNYYAKLEKAEQKRLRIFRKNVKSTTEKVDFIAACNFSYCIFKERKELLQYFKHCYKSLKKNGVLMLDLFGGTDTDEECIERRSVTSKKIKRFQYIWELKKFNPINRHAEFYIHFKFPKDGPHIKKAFYYDWRMWTLPELRDLMEEAGFSSSTVFWEGEDEDGDGNGLFTATEQEENCATWLAYIVAKK